MSALFIVLVGSHMLLEWKHQVAYLRLMAAMIVLNGVSSFAYHATADPIAGQMDGQSMILMMWLLFPFIATEFLQNIVRAQHIVPGRAPALPALSTKARASQLVCSCARVAFALTVGILSRASP